MADVISRLRLESGEFDSKIKRAGQELMAYSEHCKKMGLEMGYANKDAKDFAKALGDMNTVSQTARGKLNELTEAFVNLKTMYNGMTDAEKQNTFGKELAASLDKLKTRIDEAKQNLNSVNAELGNTKQAEDGAKSGIEGLTSALGINLKSLAGWGTAIGVAKGALDVAKDAFFASEQNLDDWQRTVYSAESVYQGFLTALNTGDISGFLDNINTIAKAASDAYNALDRLGTMKTIDAPQLTNKQSEIQRMQTMLRTGRWIDRADGVKSALGYKTGDVLPKDVLNTIAQQLKSAMGEVAGIMKQEIGAANTAIDALYKEQAARLGMSNEQFKKGTASMAVFEENLQKAQKYLDFEREHTSSVTSTTSAGFGYTTSVRDNVANPYEQYKSWNVFKDDGELYQRIVQEIRNRGAAESQYYSQVGQAYRGINRVEDVKVGGGGGKGGSGTSPQKQAQEQVKAALLAYNQTVEKAKLEMESGLKSEADMKRTLLSAQEQLWTAYGKAYNTYADPKYKEAQDAAAAEIVKLGGEVKTATEAQKAAEQATREQEAAAKKLAGAQEKLAEAQQTLADANASGDLKAIYAAQKGVETAQAGVVKAGGSVEAPSGGVALPVTVNYTTSNMEAFTGKLKEDLSKAEVGSELFNKITEQMSDSSAISAILGTAIQNGIEQMPFDASAIMQKLLNGEDISDTAIQGYVEALNEQLKATFDETEWPHVLITFDADTKQIVNAAKQQEKEAKNTTDSWTQTAQAVQQLGQAMQQIDDPTAKAAGTVLQAISSVALGFAQASVQAASMGPWGWVAFLAAGIAALTTTINTMHSLTGFANGGIIPGNSMSGDNMRGMTPDGSVYGLNAQEVVLNRAQVGNLASQLEGGVGNLQLETRVGAEELIFILNNNGNRRGFGNFIDD